MRGVRVSCYSGYTCVEWPKNFLWQGVKHEVESVERAWREPGRKLFRVNAADGSLFELCYNEEADLWSAVELVAQEGMWSEF